MCLGDMGDTMIINYKKFPLTFFGCPAQFVKYPCPVYSHGPDEDIPKIPGCCTLAAGWFASRLTPRDRDGRHVDFLQMDLFNKKKEEEAGVWGLVVRVSRRLRSLKTRSRCRSRVPMSEYRPPLPPVCQPGLLSSPMYGLRLNLQVAVPRAGNYRL